MKWLKYFLIFLVSGLLVIQLVPYGRQHENPPVTTTVSWDSPNTEALFKAACADCHSHETVWPWYSHIAPVSWMVQQEVEEGRSVYNISMPARHLDESGEAAGTIREGEMPPAIYLPTHPEANLNAEEKKALIAGLTATFSQAGGASAAVDAGQKPGFEAEADED